VGKAEKNTWPQRDGIDSGLHNEKKRREANSYLGLIQKHPSVQ